MNTLKSNHWKTLGLIFLMCVIGLPTTAKINFNDSIQDRINLEALSFEKEQFLDFVSNTIKNKPFGLGAYGRVSIKVCDMPYQGRKLIDYKTEKGIGHRYLSNPTCSQTVLGKILIKSYDFNPDNLSKYERRKCLLNVEKIFSPMLEYYTIRYEEKRKPDCPKCEDNEQRRLQKIIELQHQIGKACGNEKTAIQKFLTDLDEEIENTFKKKKSSSQ